MPTRPPIHRPESAEAPPVRHSAGSPSRRGLYDRTWQRLRRAYLAANPLCRFCEEKGRLTPAVDVDHIETIRDRPDLRLAWSNLRGLCKPCHSERTAKDHPGSRPWTTR